MAEGISPLGIKDNDCMQVTSELLPPHHSANISSMVDQWKIGERDNEIMKKALTDAMQIEMDHEKSLKKAHHSSKFIRSTERTDWIANNFRIMQTLKISEGKG